MKDLKYILLVSLFIVSIVTGLLLKIQKVPNKTEKKETINLFHGDSKPGIYILEINAPIMYQSSAESFLQQATGVSRWISLLKKIRKNPAIKGVLIRINSPGGTIAATEELFREIERLKESGKKVVVSAAEVCASGAYYISLPADCIMTNPGTLVGSIGVILRAPELSALFEKLGISMNTIKSGKYKDILASNRKMTEAERASLQTMVDIMYEQFLQEVLKYRVEKSSEKRLREICDGRVMSGKQALAEGLIDRLGDFEDSTKYLAELCELDYKTLKIYRDKKNSFMKFIEMYAKFSAFFEKKMQLEYRLEGI